MPSGALCTRSCSKRCRPIRTAAELGRSFAAEDAEIGAAILRTPGPVPSSRAITLGSGALDRAKP